MDGNLLKDLIDFYQNQLLLGFYRKRGKSIAIPHVLYAIERLVERNEKRTIRVLDVGCGKGDLLALINGIARARGYDKRIELHGIDNNQEMLNQASSLNFKSELYFKDLRHDLLDNFEGSFDVIICINTIHEVFSQLLGANEVFPEKKFKQAKKSVENLILKIINFLGDDGTLIFYDGLDVSNKKAKKSITFKIKSEALQKGFLKFVKDYAPWRLVYKRHNNNIYEMNYRDFTRFITTFRYLNTELWLIERRESYSYFDLDEFQQILTKSGAHIESLIPVGNDMGLWSNHLELVSNGLYFPFKAVLLVAAKSYVSSTYDYFDV